MMDATDLDLPPSIGLMDDVDAFATQHQIPGSILIDIGCGDGTPAIKLADRGATVTALDPDLRRSSTPYGPTKKGGRASFQTGSALALPVKENSVDAALFIFSMHHVPIESMQAALVEAIRVVKPGGLVYVAEPTLIGTAEEVCRHFHDETDVRLAAQDALNCAEPLFASRKRFTYDAEYVYTDYEDYLKEFAHYDFPDSGLRSTSVVAAFEACKTARGYVLGQPILVDAFRTAAW